MVVVLPYKLREGQIAYAAKVMANLEALLGAFNKASVDGLGNGDVVTLLRLLYEAAVMANKEGNAEEIVFDDGQTLVEKFNGGTLNASLLDSDGLFYFTVDQDTGHLLVTASDKLKEGDFSINSSGHLIYTLHNPETNTNVHTYDLGNVRGPAGPNNGGDMQASVYDPSGKRKDLNKYVGWFNCYGPGWGGYYYTYDNVFKSGKVYYILNDGAYTPAIGLETGDALPENTFYELQPSGQYYSTRDTHAQPGKTYYTHVEGQEPFIPQTGYIIGAVIPPEQYYEKLPDQEYLLTDYDHVSGDFLAGNIGKTFGHALIGPDIDATDEQKQVWSIGNISAVAQDDGRIRLRALGIAPGGNDTIPLFVILFR